VKRDGISNEEIADRLDHVADLLELEEENAFRVRSYRNAAQTVRDLDQPVTELMQQCTVVTAGRGKLEGKRVVRGRERECREYYGL